MSGLKKTNNNKVSPLFKKRKKLKVYNYSLLKLGNFGFLSKNEFRFEFVYFSLLKKLLKYNFKNKVKYKIDKKYWIFLSKNYPIFSKSKNARMGKGKGLFIRWSFRLKKYFIFFEVLGLNFFIILKIFKIIKKKINPKLYLFSKNLIFHPIWSKPFLSFNLTKRYNYF